MRCPLIIAACSLFIATQAFADEGDNINFDFNGNAGIESLEETASVNSSELETNAYYTIRAGGLLQFFGLQASLGVPLRLASNNFAIRARDWDETSDYLRIASCARFDFMSQDGSTIRIDEDGRCSSWTPDEAVGAVSGGRSDFTYLSLRLAPMEEYSLGYGSVIYGYRTTLEEDEFRDGLILDLNLNRYVVANAGLSDILNPTVGATRVAFRPVQANRTGYDADGYEYDASSDTFYDTYRQTDTAMFAELGVTAAADFQAPVTEVDSTTGTRVIENQTIAIGGLDGRFRWSSESTDTTENYRVYRLEVGGEYNQIFGFDGGAHGHLRYYHDVGWLDFFLDGEYRYVGGQYIPRYFDQHYRVQRNQFQLSNDQRSDATLATRGDTKLDALRALEPGSDHGYAVTSRFRFWTPVEGGWTPAVTLNLFFEGIPDRPDSNAAGATLTVLNIDDTVDATATFIQQGWDNIGGFFTTAQSIMQIEAIYYLTEIYLTFYFDQTWFESDDDFQTTNNFGVNVGFYQ